MQEGVVREKERPRVWGSGVWTSGCREGRGRDGEAGLKPAQ